MWSCGGLHNPEEKIPNTVQVLVSVNESQSLFSHPLRHPQFMMPTKPGKYLRHPQFMMSTKPGKYAKLHNSHILFLSSSTSAATIKKFVLQTLEQKYTFQLKHRDISTNYQNKTGFLKEHQTLN